MTIKDKADDLQKQRQSSLDGIINSEMQKISKMVSQKIDEILKYIEKEKEIIKTIIQYHNVKIEELNLPPRPYNALKKASIDTVAGLITNSEVDLLNLKNGFGKKSLKEVKQALAKYGLDVRDPSYSVKQKTSPQNKY